MQNKTTEMEMEMEMYDGIPFTQLQSAIMGKNMLYVKWLLENNTNINGRNRSGDTPLIFMIRHIGDEDRIIRRMFKLLLKRGADLNALSHLEKRPALFIACYANQLLFFKIILKHLVNADYITIADVDQHIGISAVHNYSLNSHLATYHYINELLLRLCRDVSTKKNDNLSNNCRPITPPAYKYSRYRAIKELLELNVNFDYNNHDVRCLFNCLSEKLDDSHIQTFFIYYLYHLIRRHPLNITEIFAIEEFQQYLKYKFEIQHMNNNFVMDTQITYLQLLLWNCRRISLQFNDPNEIYQYFKQSRQLIRENFPYFYDILLEKLKMAKYKADNLFFNYGQLKLYIQNKICVNRLSCVPHSNIIEIIISLLDFQEVGILAQKLFKIY